DEILEVGGTPVPTWNDLLLAVALSPNTTVDFTIRRDGQTLTVPVSVRATERERIGIVGVGPHNPILISSVEKGSAAEEAGLKPGDQVVGVGDTSVDGPAGADTFVQIVSASAGRPLDFHVMRDGARIRLSVTPREVTQRGETRGWVGVALSGRIGLRQYGPIEAFRESLIYNWEQTGVLFLTLKKLFTFQLSPRTLSGPIDIYRLTGESMRGGGIFYLTFMAMVSLQLGIINLLPIPILDGGHIFILLIEGTIRRDLSMKIKERVMQFGFVLLLLIMGTVLFFDVDKNFPALRNLLGQ
ncbi:MAG TPA: RIP metalloprotease RseP, partial [Candidatus Polarisedimenticolia bacterium]|nr:RIP metalloprotease RseP [Candidatus Polarisedimenticolia bacterium]